MESRACNIVLLPSNILANQAINTSAELASGNTLFTLQDGACYPHVSLYMLQLKTRDYDKVRGLLQNIANSFSSIDLTAITYAQNRGFLDAEYLVTAELQNLQNTIVKKLNPIRNGMREIDKQRMEQADGVKREYFENYGYPNVKKLFRPHLTLTRFNNDRPYNEGQLPDIITFNGMFDRLGFFESGDNGTCVNLLSSYSLN